MPAGGLRRAAGVALALACVIAPSACKRKHVPVEAVPELGYPACGDAGQDDPGTTVFAGHIRSGELSTERNVVERFELRRTSCGYTFRSRQEWPLAISDVEVRYDPGLTPTWAWKRMTIPGSPREDGAADIRRYDLRTGDVFIKHRDAEGELTLQKLLPGGRVKAPQGARVGAVVGPGRGIISAWLRHARMAVGEKTHELVLDFRDMIESLEMGALERNPDQYEPSFGKTVRVYTFFGKETVFADDDDVVIGDLAGMRPSDSVPFPEPEPMPTYGPLDPAHTP
ncbi:MAG TPA: hypothetical protein VIF15_14590 [Polyangiaceae bacterium]